MEDKVKLEKLLKLAEQNDLNAIVDLGDYYINEKDDKEAKKWYEKGAEQNDAYSLYMYATYFEEDEDYSEAIKIFEKSSSLGYSSACIAIAEFHEYGVYFEQSTTNAINVLKEFAAREYNEEIIWKIATLYNSSSQKEEVEKCLEFYQILSDNDVLPATNILGVSYAHGKNGAKIDKDKSFEYYFKAANAGWIYAMVNLGFALIEISKYEDGVAWFKKASEVTDDNFFDVALEATGFYNKYKKKYNL